MPKGNASSIGLIGFGAFGKLIAAHLCRFFKVIVVDPAISTVDQCPDTVMLGVPADMARCGIVIFAVPVSELSAAISSVRTHLRTEATVVDVGSVKVVPARVMLAELPPTVSIVGTHPLFGPQSARLGIRGRKIAVCPIRGRAIWRIAAFLRGALGLKVFIATPEEHDREAAIVQGVTHLIAKVLVQMEPLPTRMTTASFDLLMQATEMVRYDAPGVFFAIERRNPFAAEVRERFFALAAQARSELEPQQ